MLTESEPPRSDHRVKSGVRAVHGFSLRYGIFSRTPSLTGGTLTAMVPAHGRRAAVTEGSQVGAHTLFDDPIEHETWDAHGSKRFPAARGATPPY